MRAIVQTAYGSSEVIQPRELEKPEPGEGEVLVRVHAASLAAGDYFGMRGKPLPARLWIGFPSPKEDYVVGMDLAGTVEAIGENVTSLAVGDRVFGEGGRACAEYSVVAADKLARIPAELTFHEAAAIPTSAATALMGLRDQGNVQPGQKVLINGASGGVGTFAVQIAKALGAEVTGVCSTRNVETVTSLGADHVIDYKREDFTKGGPRYDLILDNVASHPLSQARKALVPTGKHIPSSGHAGMSWIIGASLSAIFVSQQSKPFVAVADRENLTALSKMVEAGQLRPYIDKTYTLENTAQAFAYLDEGHARGKVVISVIAEEVAGDPTSGVAPA